MIARTLKLAAILGSMAMLAPQPAAAQEEIELTPEMIQQKWWIAEFEGQTPGGSAATFELADENRMVVGTTQCDTEWYASIKLDMPAITIDAPQTTAYSCQGSDNIRVLFDLMEKVTSFRGSPDGLELIDASGKRLILMVQPG
ncbi:META domain-containing protein [Altererythrobacter xixiisoli]|uniref:META domain-containing protein n=1 Tax=Croceibacterium xixiisoli TaxID=1476466 RepID=A0A6I4TV89_9SPHN|nr:META domain-containing protein [Croceibacterium xixiisoli]MXO99150.1 META domain-containing protein [Croceibacterium xixiisoli]